MDLDRALQTTGAVRDFSARPVPDEVVHHILDIARYAPSGGNRQAWQVILVKDPDIRRRLRDLYLRAWYEYLAIAAAGLVPWAPADGPGGRTGRRRPAAHAWRPKRRPAPAASPSTSTRFRCCWSCWPTSTRLAAVDRDLDRYTLVGGASIYPFAWSILLAAHGAGLGGVITTMVVRSEDEVRDLLGVPPDWAVAGALALGYPAGGAAPPGCAACRWRASPPSTASTVLRSPAKQ